MTNLITLTIPNDDSVALYHLGKSLIDMSSTIDGCPYWVILPRDQYDALVRGAEKDAHYPVENYVHMYHADTDVYRLARSDNEVAELLAEGYVQHTQAQYDAWEPKRNRDVETGTIGDVQLQDELVTAHVKITSPQAAVLITDSDSTGTPWDERIHSTSKALNSDGSWRLRRKPKDMDEAEWAALVESVKAELMHGDAIREAMDKAERGEAVYYTSEEAEQKMEEFKESLRSEPPATPSGEKLCIDEGCDHHDTPHICVTGIEPPVTLSDAVNASIEAVHAGMSQEFGTGIANAAFTGDRNEPPTVAGISPIPVPPPVVVPPVPVADEAWDFPKLMKFLTERHGRITVEEVNALLAVDGLAALTDLNAHPDKIGPFVTRVKAHLGE